MTAAARRKTPADPARTRYYTAIHAGAAALGWDEDQRRDVMGGRYGVRSAKELSMEQLGDFARYIRNAQEATGRRKPKRRQPARAGRRALADGAQAAKVRALWLSLYHLGELADPSEAALDAWVERQTREGGEHGVDSMRFGDQQTFDTAIRGLRNWCARCGFRQPSAAQVRAIDAFREAWGTEPGGHGIAAKVLLVAALRRRLGRDDSSRGSWILPAEALDRLIEELGARVRASAGR